MSYIYDEYLLYADSTGRRPREIPARLALIRAKAVQPAGFGSQIADQWLGLQAAAGHALQQFGSRIFAALLVVSVLQPGMQRAKLPPRDLGWNLRMCLQRGVVKLGANDVAQRVTLK